jgi:hypothetical protein
MSSTKRKKVAESEQTIKTPEALLKKNTAADEKKNKAAAVNAKTARPLPKKKSARGSGSPAAVEVAASSPPASSKKRSKPASGHAGSESPETSYLKLYTELAHRLRAVKEIESTTADGGSTCMRLEDTTLPSFFDYYPHCRQIVESRRSAGDTTSAVELLKGCMRLMMTGSKDDMERAIGDDRVIDLSNAQSEAKQANWQLDGGPDGWLPFGANEQHATEVAFAAGKQTFLLTSLYGHYDISLEQMTQRNVHSGTVRRIRRVV